METVSRILSIHGSSPDSKRTKRRSLSQNFDIFFAEYNERIFLIKLIPIRFDSKNVMLIMMSDATESVKLQITQDTFEYKTNLFSSFTHEFKTPLNCLFVMLHSLELDENVPPNSKELYLKPAFYNVEILLNMVNAISDYSLLSLQKLKLDKSLINVKEFFQKSIEALKFQAETKKLEIYLKFRNNLPDQFRTDRRRFQQILFQLYSNAIKFTFEGSITIKVKNSEITKNCLDISIKDTGIGISESEMAKIKKMLLLRNLDLQKNNENSIGGSLGLTVCQQLALLLGPIDQGLKCQSSFGKGTKFSFSILNITKKNRGRDLFDDEIKEAKLNFIEKSYFVLENSSPSPSPSPKSKENSNLSSRINYDEDEQNENKKENIDLFRNTYSFPEGKFMDSKPTSKSLFEKDSKHFIWPSIGEICEHEEVLVVDDDQFNILAMSSLLKTKKISCLSAGNGQLAIDLIMKEIEKRINCCKGFKMIFMDLNMPVLNGHETSRKLKKLFEDNSLAFAPIIACTAFDSDMEKKRCFEAGMVGYTTKPLDFKRIGELIDRWVLGPKKIQAEFHLEN